MFKNFKEYVKTNRLRVDEVIDTLNHGLGGSTSCYGSELLDQIEHDTEEEYPQDEIASQIEEYLYERGYEEERGQFGSPNWVLVEEEDI